MTSPPSPRRGFSVAGMSRSQLTGTVVTVAVTTAIAAGIYLLGSPAAERARRLDERRVEDLSGIARAVDVYWTRNARLPASLDALRTETGASITIADPASGAAYEFLPLEGEEYELCAAFEGESADSSLRFDAGFWSHRAGRQCFRREAEKVR